MDHHPEDRWRELADLLGVPGDAPPPVRKETPPRADEPTPPPPVRSVRAYEEPKTRLEEVDSVDEEPHTPALHEEPTPEWEEEFEEDDDTTIDEPAEAVEPMEASEAPAAPSAASGEDDQPRRGRRRRRRGRRRGGADQPEDGKERGPSAQQPQAAPARPPRENDADRSGGRRRGGRNRDDEGPQGRGGPPRQEREAPPPVEVEEIPERPARVAPEDTDFSDWNVPSWQDLIASLHRPDR